MGPKLIYPDRTIQHAGIVMGMTGHAYHLYAGAFLPGESLFLSPDIYRNVSAVTGACMLIRKDVFEHVGGFDERLKLIFNDVELCQRVRQAGYCIVYTPSAALIHYEGRSRSRYNPPDDIRLGADVLAAEIERGDRYYNPNLSLAVGWPTFRRWFEPQAIKRLREIVQHSYDIARG
ncbi:MAG: glycosyltransferase [Anaerolineaceae bacterium]|nr:glycosyltransferase [Anaerolineaceae bacterium]